MKKVYVVDLTPDEREELLGLLRGGQARVRKRTGRASCCWQTRDVLTNR